MVVALQLLHYGCFRDGTRSSEPYCQKTVHLPMASPLTALLAFPTVAWTVRRRHRDELYPSPLSCVLLCPAPPVARTRRLDCLAQATSSLAAGSYLRPAPRVQGLKHLPDSQAPATTPAPELLPRLALLFSWSVTSVGHTCAPGRSPVCRKLPLSHSFQSPGALISGGRTQKLPLIRFQRRLIPVRHRL